MHDACFEFEPVFRLLNLYLDLQLSSISIVLYCAVLGLKKEKNLDTQMELRNMAKYKKNSYCPILTLIWWLYAKITYTAKKKKKDITAEHSIRSNEFHVKKETINDGYIYKTIAYWYHEI